MTRIFLATTLLLSLQLQAHAVESPASLALGDDAMASKLWEIAAKHYQETLTMVPLDAETKTKVSLRLAEALIREGSPAEALDLLNQSQLAGHPEAPFWMGQAFAAMGRFKEAVNQLAPMAEIPNSPYRNEAGFTAASLLLAMGTKDAALDTLAALKKSPDPEWASRISLRQAEILLDMGRTDDARAIMPKADEVKAADKPLATFLAAHILLKSGQIDDAAASFQSLLDQPQNQTIRRYHAAAIGLADALRAKGDATAASTLLFNFIQEHQDSPLMEEMFKRLLELLPPAPTITDTILERLAQWIPSAEIPATGLINTTDGSAVSAWPTDPPTGDLLAFSLFTRASGLHRIDSPAARAEARSLINRMRLEFPNHFLTSRALLQSAGWDLEAGRLSNALHILQTIRENATSPIYRGEAAFLQARTAYENGDTSLAYEIYHETAADLSGDAADMARYNAALLQLTDPAATPTLVSQPIENREIASSLKLERALCVSDPTAKRNAIEEFLVEYPNHPRAPEARVEAAELALRNSPPDLSYARAQVDTLESAADKMTGISPARMDLLKLRIDDLTGDATTTIAHSRALRDAAPNTPEAVEASFILGRNLFQTRSYNDARIVMEKLTTTVNDAPRAQAAWLLAARSAALVPTTQSQQEALGLFDKAIQTQGPVTALAKLEKARLMIDMNRLTEAAEFLNVWFEKLQASDPLYLTVGMLLGESIYAQGSINADSLSRALAVYDALLLRTERFSANYDRIQFLRGRTLEQLPDPENPGLTREKFAFMAYYSVLERETPPQQWKYFEFAGFRALALLEKSRRWPAAIACAKKIASFNGPRAAEASARASKIQLEHMIWED